VTGRALGLAGTTVAILCATVGSNATLPVGRTRCVLLLRGLDRLNRGWTGTDRSPRSLVNHESFPFSTLPYSAFPIPRDRSITRSPPITPGVLYTRGPRSMQRVVSQKQCLANRRNARSSTGPRTPRGTGHSAAGASHPPRRAAVALVGKAAVFPQLHSTACRTPRPLDGGLGQASPLHPIRSGFMGLFGHAALRSVSPNARGKMRNLPEFRGFSLDVFAETCPHGVVRMGHTQRNGKTHDHRV